MRALILVDIQNDFCPGGSLPVAEGDRIVSVVNGIAPDFRLVIATRDWHPPGHVSFASSHHGAQPFQPFSIAGSQQIVWPDHCVAGSNGAHLDRQLFCVNHKPAESQAMMSRSV